MKQLRGLVFLIGFLAVLLLVASNAFADEIVNFTVITTSPPFYYLQGSTGAIGTITIDTTTGVVDGIDLNIPNPATEYSVGTDYGVVDPPTINSIYFQEQWCAGTAPACLGFGGYNIVIPQVALVGYDGGFICSTDNPCFGDNSAYTFGLTTLEYTSGELRATPEPSSLLLIVTGALGIGAILSRTRAKSVAEKLGA
jgi:hypothetical protein